MIKRLRNRFIRITVIAVTAVMLLLAAILNVANYISTDNDLKETLQLIYESQSTLPDDQPAEDERGDGTYIDPPDTGEAETGSSYIGENNDAETDIKKGIPGDIARHGHFSQETIFSIRYFVLRYDDEGVLKEAELDRIASVDEDDTGSYLAAALKCGEGYGKIGDYSFLVIHTGDDRNMAIFLNSHQEFYMERMVLLWSAVACAVCILLVFVLVILFSRRAIDPVVKSAKAQKQFITDAGHELKTPITVIATSLKVLEMEVGKQKWIDKAYGQTEKLKELVNSMVTLSRMDEEESPLKTARFNISDALQETAESFEDIAAAQGHELNISIEPDIFYNGDEYAIRQLVSILLDNAMKYAALNSEISVKMRAERRGILIETANKCPSPESIDTSKLFDRFYRADASRSESGSGFGIGLSIARGIAEGHKGHISARIDGEDIIFTAELR